MSALRACARVELDGFVLDVDLELASGETVAIVGPNGAGKTTLLRTIAGLRSLTAGRIALGDQVLDDPAGGVYLPPERRPIGVVFQDGSLFPHLSALENVAFGLRARGMQRGDARRRAGQWLGRVGLTGRERARPAELSGGEAQRVALARALAPDPSLLLLDEPLAALDATTRNDVRRDLRDHLASFTGTRILVTHDPVDAAVLADRVVVLSGGRVAQTGTPTEITARPRTPWVAELAGTNLYRGTARGTEIALADGGMLRSADASTPGRVFVVAPPRAVSLHASHPEGSPRNVWQGTVMSVEAVGDRVRVRVDGTPPITAELTAAAARELGLHDGSPVWIAVKATEIDVYPA
jgi:molybdate transport system ATP-binding protein